MSEDQLQIAQYYEQLGSGYNSLGPQGNLGVGFQNSMGVQQVSLSSLSREQYERAMATQNVITDQMRRFGTGESAQRIVDIATSSDRLHSEIAELRKEVEGVKAKIASLPTYEVSGTPVYRHVSYGFVGGSLRVLSDEEAARLCREHEASPEGRRMKAALETSLFNEVPISSPDPALSAMNKKWSNAALLDTDASPKA